MIPVDLPRALISSWAAIYIGGTAISRLVHLCYNLGCTRERNIPKPRCCCVGTCISGGELLAGTWIFSQENPSCCRLDVVWLVDFVDGLDRVIVAFDENCEGYHNFRIVRIEHHLPNAAIG